MTQISTEHREQYASHGVTHVAQAFDGRWIERLTGAFDRLQDLIRRGLTLPHSGEPAAKPLDGDWDAASGKAHLRNAAPHDIDVRAWALESPAGEIVASLLDVPQVQLWYDLWFCKEPVGNAESATPWHHDSVGHCFEGPDIPALWIALTDVGEDDAPLLTMPGSHLDARLFPPPYAPGKENMPLPDNFTPIDVMHREVAAQESRIQTWRIRAGDCLVIHPQTWHASKPQRSLHRRRLACTSRWIGPQLAYRPGHYSFDGYDTRTSALPIGARPPYSFLPFTWRRGLA